MMRDWLSAQAQARPEGAALIIGDTTLMYRALHEQTATFASRLAAAGVEQGAVVGVLLSNRLEAALAVHAAPRLGVTLALFNTRLTPAELDAQVRAAACRILVCERDTLLAALALPSAPHVLCVDPVDDPRLTPVDRISGDSAAYCEGAIDLDAPFVMMFTSGTTGTPRGVVLTYGAFFASAMASAYRIGVLPGDRWLCVLPLYHVGGLSILLRSCLYGTAVDLWQRFDAPAITERLKATPVTLISLVPTMLYRLLDDAGDAPPNLRLVLLGGAAAPTDLLERALEAGWPIATTYGLTEAASQVATALPDEVRRKPGSVGRPLIFTHVRVTNEQGRDQPPGVYGNILVRGPTLMRGYLGEAPLDADAWFATGDIGYLDADGDLWVVQRRSDLIISGGENIYPAEVEQALRQHPAVADVAVVGVPSAEWGQQVGAAIVLRDPSVSVEAILAFSRTRLAGYKQPRVVRIVAELPRTASGKIQREAVINLLKVAG
ncbi:o-succinylbenzoate--CoA ligase [Roseiflexus sp.]|uniref:o-succinylbenzoate--CoA ligase n=1 Tax=Roseiflexus sp. TaxID=2562120 RepID=UPI0021DDA054|nr:o-succinylbenzoate--CoA ligase [Roseiflexus sp.]GIW03146.1 MAG: 2-succinylbenzoate--CoA ligase [Roseiflexus sp.]